MDKVEQLVGKLKMDPIPEEGGWFARKYTSKQAIDGRPVTTSIYALFTELQFSALHRLDADEIFFYQSGCAFQALELLPDGSHRVIVIGPDLEKGHCPQYTFKRGAWFGGKPVVKADCGYSLLSCVMSPGFVYEGFELGFGEELIENYPDAERLIADFVR
ncbi:cupin domain-containing protein [Puniceicoccaceae bacterium K14]|nr:cupin domain-containing protein [Puniceicoccaceae bacterium K14]